MIRTILLSLVLPIAAGAQTPTGAWSLAAGVLPAGLTLAENGELSGKPTQAGVFNFTVRATVGEVSKEMAVAITMQPSFEITSPVTLPNAVVGGDYSIAFDIVFAEVSQPPTTPPSTKPPTTTPPPAVAAAKCLDRDGDGYGVGEGCLGPDADYADASVHTAQQGIQKHGSLLAFIKHLGYSPKRIWYFDAVSGNDSNKCVVAAASFSPETTPRCKNYYSGEQVIASNAALGGAKPGDLFLFRAGTVAPLKFDGRMKCTSAAPCTFLVYPGETFTIDNSKNAGADGITAATGYARELCASQPCTLKYEDYAKVQNAAYVTYDGFTITNSTGPRGQGISGYGGDHIAVRHFHVYNVARGSFFNDSMSNLLVEESSFHDTSSSHASYWGSIYGVPRNVVFRNNLLYKSGLPHFQFNGRAEGMVIEGNIIYGDIGSNTPAISLMKGGGTSKGYSTPSYIRNNVVRGVCNVPLAVVNYADIPSQNEYQWPVTNLVIEGNSFTYPKTCSANGRKNDGTNSVMFFMSEGLSLTEKASAPYWYGGAGVTEGVVIRNNTVINEAATSGPGPFIQVATRSSTYGVGGGGPQKSPETPDGVAFLTYGIRDPRVEAAKLTIQGNKFVAPNLTTPGILWAQNCYYGTDASMCVRTGGATLPTAYQGLTSKTASYGLTDLTTLNPANTGNVRK